MDSFRCKQFEVFQEGVAMRVNTDGVLLGAWVSLHSVSDVEVPVVLDIGTGSGVIALMLAQRLFERNGALDFHIDALEPHASSAQAAAHNFIISPWSCAIQGFECTLQDFVSQRKALENNTQYDFIVSNPPYFKDSLRPPVQERCLVRHTDLLSSVDLLRGVADLLKPSGLFGVVLPFLQQKDFVKTALSVGLHLCRETTLYTLPERSPKRILMEFSKKEEPLVSDSLLIHDSDYKSFSEEYVKLVKPFFLAF